MKPERDALVFRDLVDGSWEVRRIAAPRLLAYQEGGWTLLISEQECRANDIADAFLADQLRPFNRPRVR